MNRIFTPYFDIHMKNVQNCLNEIIEMMREHNVTEVDIPIIEDGMDCETNLSISRVYEDYYYTDYIKKVKIEGDGIFTTIKVVDLGDEERYLAEYISEDCYMVYEEVFFIFDKMTSDGKD